MTSSGVILRRKNDETLFEKSFLIIVLAVLIVITGLRDFSIGNDTTQYVYFFNEFKDGNFDPTYRIEIGYQLFCYIIGRFTSNPHIFFLIYATICYTLFGIYIYKNSKNVPLSLCLLFCLFFSVYTNILRQGLVILFLLFGLSFLRKNKFIKAAILFILAGFIHATGFFFLILLLYKVFPRNMKFYAISFIVALAIALSNVLGILVDAVFPQYSHYIAGQYDGSGTLAVALHLVIGLFIFAISYRYYKAGNTNNDKLALMCNFLLVISYTLGFSLNLLTRIGQYFLAVAVINLPNAIMGYRNKRSMSIMVALVFIIYFFVIITFRSEWNVLYPYHFFWE